MTLVCLTPVSHQGVVYPVGAELPADVDPERLLRVGAAEDPKPKAKPRAKAGE